MGDAVLSAEPEPEDTRQIATTEELMTLIGLENVADRLYQDGYVFIKTVMFSCPRLEVRG
jgi:hypothetical protein